MTDHARAYLYLIFNSQGTENFPFSYFANPKLKLIKVVKDIKNINTFDKTRTHGLDFEQESFNRFDYMTPFHFSLKGKSGVQNAICAPGVK